MEMINTANNSTKARFTPAEATALLKILIRGGRDGYDDPYFALTHEECVIVGQELKELMDCGADLSQAMKLRWNAGLNRYDVMTFMCICAFNSRGNDYWVDKARNLRKDFILLTGKDVNVLDFLYEMKDEDFSIVRNFLSRVSKSEAIAPTT